MIVFSPTIVLRSASHLSLNHQSRAYDYEYGLTQGSVATCRDVGHRRVYFNTTEFAPVGLLSDIADSFGMETAGGHDADHLRMGGGVNVAAVYAADQQSGAPAPTYRPVYSVYRQPRPVVFARNFDVLVISRIGIAFAHAVFWSITSALAIRMAPPANGRRR